MRRTSLLLCALALCASSTVGHAQAAASKFQLFLDPACDCRHTLPTPENVNVAPVFDPLPATAEFTQNLSGSFDLAAYCSDGNDDILTYSKQSGTYPTGLSLTGSVVSGTPTVVETKTIGFRCDDGSLHDDESIDLVVSAPPIVPDTTPDPFVFVAQSGVAVVATVTSDSVTPLGFNTSTAVTVSNGLWSKNGGSFLASAGTIVPGDAIRLRHTAAATNSTNTVTTLTVGGIAGTFTSTTEASPARVGIIYRLSSSSLTPRVNPENAQWDAPNTSDTDGAVPKHAGKDQYALPAPAKNLPHLEIVSGNGECGAPLDSDGKWLRGTVYPLAYSPVVNYSSLNGGLDKPRIDLLTEKAHDTLSLANANWFNVEKEHHFAFGICLPSNYVEDTDEAREFLFFIQGSGVPSSQTMVSLSIKGAPSGAVWQVERKRVTSAGEQLVDQFETPVTNAHKGAWVIHSFDIRLDNRTVGATPKFEWVMNVNGQAGTVIASDNTTRYGMTTAISGGRFIARMNLPYKGSWHGATSPGYSGNKTSPIVIGMDGYRVGDLTSSYSDVHPTRDAHP